MPTVVFRLAGQDLSGQEFRPIMAGYQLCCGAAACQERRIVASPNHVKIYLATSTMTLQFKESKLREEREVPHVVGIEKGDALDGPVRRSSAKCFAWLTEGGRVSAVDPVRLLARDGVPHAVSSCAVG